MTSEQELEQKQNSLKSIYVLKGVFKYLKPYTKEFLFAIILDIFVCTSFNIEPLLQKGLLDYLSVYLQSGGVGLQNSSFTIIMYSTCDMLLWFLAGLGAYFVNFRLKIVGQKVIKDIRDEMFGHILKMSLAQLKKLKIGSYVTRITNDSQNLSSLFSDVLPQLFRSIISLFVILITTFIVTSKEGCFYLGFILLLYIPIVFFITYFFRKKAKKYYRAERKAISNTNSFLSETFQGVKVIKTFSKEEKKKKEFDKHNDEIRTAFLKNQHIFAIYHPMMYLLQVTCILLCISVLIPIISNPSSNMKIGTFQLVYTNSAQFFQPIQTLANLLNNIENILTSAERIQVLFDENCEDLSEDIGINVDRFKGKVEFKNVSFAYDKNDYVLKNLSFVINEGESAAFIGATGAGKSTLISLINRTYEPDSGQILIDDIDIKDYSLTCLRKNIGVMLQDVFIFQGTIKENITLGDKSKTDQQVLDVCKYVGADKFIEAFQNKYDTFCDERGNNLSSGQRQLISFARTLIYQPSLVLLDEATANIDTETENIIQSSLDNIKKIGTTIIVAHRLSTIKKCNKIFVMDKGKLVESGTHDELLNKKGLYYKLYNLQNMPED